VRGYPVSSAKFALVFMINTVHRKIVEGVVCSVKIDKISGVKISRVG